MVLTVSRVLPHYTLPGAGCQVENFRLHAMRPVPPLQGSQYLGADPALWVLLVSWVSVLAYGDFWFGGGAVARVRPDGSFHAIAPEGGVRVPVLSRSFDMTKA